MRKVAGWSNHSPRLLSFLMQLFHQLSINFYPYLFVSLTGLAWSQLLSVETTDIWNADSEVTETELTQPATHVLREGKQPSPLLTLPRCLVLLRCSSARVSHLCVSSSSWWWVAGAVWDGLSHLGVTSWNQGSCVTRSGTFHWRKGKMKSVWSAARQLREWDSLFPHQKTHPCHGLVSHWLNLRAKHAENLWKLQGRMKAPEEKCNFHLWL